MTRLQKRLYHLRFNAGLTYEQVEQKTGGHIGAGQILCYEKGLAEPHPDDLRVLAKLFRVDYLDLLILAGVLKRTELNAYCRAA